MCKFRLYCKIFLLLSIFHSILSSKDSTLLTQGDGGDEILGQELDDEINSDPISPSTEAEEATGGVGRRNPKIVGGRLARRGEFPYLLSLRYRNRHICGAAIINARGALTAAHCVTNGKNVSAFSVVAGEYKLDQLERGEQHVTVAKISVHPLYDSTEEENDIAYLHLEKEFIFDNRLVKKIRVANENDAIPETAMLTTSGWGKISGGVAGIFLTISNKLQTVELPLVSNRQCHKVYKNVSVTITDTMLCAGDLLEGGKDSCQGDSGGPITMSYGRHNSNLNTNSNFPRRGDRFSKEFLVGITSFGEGCGQAAFPGVYTRVSKFGDWIRKVGAEEGPQPQQDDGSVCGGLVFVQDQSELFYKNPGGFDGNEDDPLLGQPKTCMWVITTSKYGGQLGLKLTQLDTSSEGAIGNLSLKSVADSENNSMNRLTLPVTTSQLGMEVILNYSEVVLIFTSVAGQGFHFDLREELIDPIDNYNSHEKIMSRFTTRLISLGGESGSDSKTNNFLYNYPKHNGSTYAPNHRRYIMIHPRVNEVIKLSVQFVDTQEGSDFLKVYKFSQTQQDNDRLVFLRQYTGSLGLLGGGNRHSFQSNLNGPMLLFFQSDEDVQAHGFNISYSYQAEESLRKIPPFSSQCGGLIDLTNESGLAYHNANENQDHETCVWVIRPPHGGSMGLVVRQALTGSTGSLSVYGDLSLGNLTEPQFLQQEDENKNFLLENGYGVIVSSSKFGQNFQLEFWDEGEATDNKKLKISTIFLTPQVKIGNNNCEKYSYPAPSSSGSASTSIEYENNEHRLVIINGVYGEKLQLKFNYIHTEKEKDAIDVFRWSDGNGNKFSFLERLSGKLGPLTNASIFEGNTGQPMLLHFQSDYSFTYKGFKFLYCSVTSFS